jgi:hypothetical protein
MSGQKRGKPFQKRSRSHQKSSVTMGKGIEQLLRLLMRFLHSFGVLLTIPMSFLQTKEKKHFASRRPSFLPLFSKQRFLAKTGFILPTIAILLLIMSLVVSSLLFRSVNRTTQTIAERNQQIIYNAATPAIDRAKAKLEYLFRQDARFPGGLPSDRDLEEMLKNLKADKQDIDPSTSAIDNPYDFPGETRLDLNDDNVLDNAWLFQLDTNGDGQQETVAYSVLVKTQDTSGVTTVDRKGSDSEKANKMVVRNGPINLIRSSDAACQDIYGAPEGGWDAISSATVRRAFQVTALVVDNANQANRTVATLEMQQDRQADRGNKWGAWFRNDLEIFPGPAFRWNGAMHTEGNLIIGDSSNFQAYLISSPNSCLYTRENSEVSIGGNSDETTPPFLGQMINGSMKLNTYTGSSRFDLYNSKTPIPTVTLDQATDSVKPTAANENPADISIDPVVVFTSNQNRNRKGDDKNTNVRDGDWKKRQVNTEGRIINQSARAPYVDDTYRADNRYGPKPEYNDRIKPFIEEDGTPTGKKTGDPILSTDKNYGILTTLSATDPENQGLDGYWERRAWAEGLRVIVGQRLELGNAFGWQGSNDPLYPPQTNAASGSSMSARANEQRQWKTMRDNLAAVQATAVYHSAGTSRDFPIACLATTAHPGTQQTIINSTTFNVDSSGVPTNTNFLTGNGTNGWEFNPPTVSGTVLSNTTFASAIASNQPLGRALRNLARFAGDPYGAFPPKQETSGTIVHPEPTLTMWGSFSNLRQVFSLMDASTNPVSYSDLSIADKTTLQTAACTMGMLAYQLDNLRDLNYASTTATDTINQAELITLDTALQGVSLPNGSTPDTYINALPAANRAVALLIHLKEQVARDRRFGFANVPATAGQYQYAVQYVSGFVYGGQTYNAGDTINLGFDYSNAATGNNFFGFGNPNTVGDLNGNGNNSDDRQAAEQQFIRLATSISPRNNNSKFPSLFYLFPVIDHFHDGAATTTALATNVNATVTQPSTELYVSNSYITSSGVNSSSIYRVLQDTNGGATNGVEDGTDDGIGAIAIQPKARASWSLPNTTTTTGRVNLITQGTTSVAVPFLDKGIFNGREMMAVRVLDLDLDQLRRNSIGGETWLPNSGIIYAFREDAVREDGIARPSLETWANCDTANELGSTAATNNCRINATGTNPVDPPINSTTGISTKPVDFYADPDRRPHGFRLRKGEYIRHPVTNPVLRGLAFISDNPVYIMGDNCAFNLHSSAENATPACNNIDTNRIEEFTNLLDDDWGDFYTRGSGGTNGSLNTTFGRAGDTWRPAEIIADGISVLSNSFVDGSIAEGIRRADNGSRSSFRTLNAPGAAGAAGDANRSWVREDGSVSNAVNAALPIKISRNGFPLYCVNTTGNDSGNLANPNSCTGSSLREQAFGRENDALPSGFTTKPNGGTNRTYMTFDDSKDRIGVANNHRMNATVVSALVPSRAGQSYGGFHNFPRFLENWGGRDLHIAGAFIQLNFSTSATAPFDQDSWESGLNPQSNDEDIAYYNPPNRRWGYDVGLQYAPAGPVSKRFVTPSNTRSEFYRELPIDDEYVKRLRCARPGIDTDGDGNIDNFIDLNGDGATNTNDKIDSQATCS